VNSLQGKIGVMGHISAYQFFQITRLTAVIAISIILVKSGFDTAGVSRYERFIFLANLFSFFWVMGIKNATLAYFPKLNTTASRHFFALVFILLQLAGILFGLVLFIASSSQLTGAGNFTGIPDRLLLAGYLVFYAPTVLIEVILILRQRARLLARYGLVIHGLQLLLIGGAAIAGHDIRFLFALLLLWTVLKWIYTLWIVTSNSRFTLRLAGLKDYAWFSLPLIVHMLLGNGMEFVDGLLVNRFFDPGLFAVFRYGARELPFVLILIGALSSTAIPMAVKSQEITAATLKKHTRRLMHLFYPLTIGLLLVSPFLFRFFYSEAYLQSAGLFNIYLLILISRILLPEVFMYGKHQNRALMYVSFGELLLNLSLSLVLLQRFGLEGIAFATVIAFLVSKLFLAGFIWLRYRIKLKEYIDLPIYALYSALLIIAYAYSISSNPF
jgi:O-antigen/teichoic acid export membrane protein